jgi:nucleoside-diphosphate-sugar epimerase
MKRALVTGGGGFVGLAVVRKLVGMGVETSVVGRHRYNEVERLGARCLVGDIRDREFVTSVMAGHDTVFHVAAKAGVWGSRKEYFSINVTGTENVISACLENGVRFLVHTSTPSVVFDGRDIQGGDETLPYSRNPLCHYAASKIAAEKRVLATNSEKLKTTVLRPHLVWGPGDTQIIPRLVQRGRQGDLKIVGRGKNLVDISYIDNVALAHILAAENLAASGKAAGEPFFISQGKPVVLWDWINELFAHLGLPAVTRIVPYTAAYSGGWIIEKVYQALRLRDEPKMTRFLAEQLAKSHWFSISKAERILSYSPPVSTREGMKKLLGWLEKEERPEFKK